MTSQSDPVDASPGSSLCTECGLCCTGALHDYAVLEPDEVASAQAKGLTLRPEGRTGFALPCPKLSGTCCSIYGERPTVCRRFKCALLEQLEDGAIEARAARSIVNEARRFFDAVNVQLPTGMTIPDVRTMIKVEPVSNVDADRRSSEMRLRLAVTALSLFLDRHFRKSGEGPLLLFETIADDRQDSEMK